MRIGLVILHADASRGGAERYTIDLADALRRRGHDVDLVASTFAPGTAGVVHLPTRGPTRVGRYRRFLDALDRHLDQTRYDIIHAMLPVRRCDVYHPHAGIAVASAGVSDRVFNPRRAKFALVERELLTASKGPVVLCLSEYVKRKVAEHYPLPPDRLATLFNATDLDKFDPATRPDAGNEVRRRFAIVPDRVVALMIAQDFARKGLREAILATARVKDERLVLLVVGKENPAPYARLASAEGAASRVIFAGQTTDSYSFYRAADFFVLPTRHDPCSLVVLEALAMGVPVISTVFNGACEVMTDGVHGYVLAGPEPGPLADAMRKLTDARRRQEMREACLALRPALSYERHLDRLLGIYQSIGFGRSGGINL